MHLDHAKLIWDRLSEVYEGHRTRHDPWFEDFRESLKAMAFKLESSSSASCLMAKDAKITECYLSESSDDESGDEFGPNYAKLASLFTKQQKAMEHIQKLLDKSDDLLDAEMTRSQSLIEDIKKSSC